MDERSQSYRCVFRLSALALIGMLICTQSGCSIFTMAGKMIFGDPKLTAAFRSTTGNNLAKEGRKVIIICSTPEAVKTDFPSLEFDLLDQIARNLKSHNVVVINPDDVATWLDDRGGYSGDPQELTEEFDSDFIIHVDLERFGYIEENSPSLFRGRASGNVFVYKVIENKDETKRAQQIYVSEYVSVYPKNYPISTERMSDQVFRKRYLDRVSEQIAQIFYDHPVSETIE